MGNLKMDGRVALLEEDFVDDQLLVAIIKLHHGIVVAGRQLEGVELLQNQDDILGLDLLGDNVLRHRHEMVLGIFNVTLGGQLFVCAQQCFGVVNLHGKRQGVLILRHVVVEERREAESVLDEQVVGLRRRDGGE